MRDRHWQMHTHTHTHTQRENESANADRLSLAAVLPKQDSKDSTVKAVNKHHAFAYSCPFCDIVRACF